METSDLFNTIAPHYDRWSNLLSGEGIRAWHHFALEKLQLRPGMTLLDVGCGTGTNTRAMAEKLGESGSVTGLDPSEAMLAEARRKEGSAGMAAISWVAGAAEALPFSDASFDRVTAQFSLRNMHDWVAGLSEMARVLKPGGRLVILDVVQPMSALGSLAWRGLQTVTRTLSNDDVSAYQWLGRSVEHAPTATELSSQARTLGLHTIETHHWLGDLVTVLSAEAPLQKREVSQTPITYPVVWATDGSMTSLLAASWLNRYAVPGASIHIVTVIPHASIAQAVQETDRARWLQELNRAGKLLEDGRFSIKEVLLESIEPGPRILHYAQSIDSGLIVVGNKGRSWRADQWMGSVARYLSEHADRPILTIPTSFEQPDQPQDSGVLS